METTAKVLWDVYWLEVKKGTDLKYYLFYIGTKNYADVNGVFIAQGFDTMEDARSYFIAKKKEATQRYLSSGEFIP